MAVTFESMSNSLIILLFLSIAIFFTTLYKPTEEINNNLECKEKIDLIMECIEEAHYLGICKKEFSGSVKIKNNYIFCDDLYFKSKYLVRDNNITSKEVKCFEERGAIICKDT